MQGAVCSPYALLQEKQPLEKEAHIVGIAYNL